MATSRPRPLFYQSSKCVALYLEVNIRFELYLRCPRFRSVHKTEPVRIHDLKVRPNDFEINGTVFSVETISLRMSNQEPPFTYIQLAMTTGTAQKVERVEYDKNLKIARDYILGRIFGVKKVQVGSLQIGEDKCSHVVYISQGAEEHRIYAGRPGNAFHMRTLSGQILPLLPVPEGKLEIAEMRVTGNLKNALASIKTSLSKSNPPLKKLTYAYQPLPDDPVLQNAEVLCIVGNASLKVFNGNRNSNRIHLRSCNIVQADFMNLINKWEWEMEKSDVGRFYSIGFKQEKLMHRFFRMFRNLPGAERGENDESRLSKYRECVIIPMRDETELNVWCERTSEEDKAYCDNILIVKIKVQNSGYAQVHGLF
ncbi:hypothetical protein GCK72_004128 [Caenorhabditis remanei]|uniref:F-box associated domain-containing protein n=1 Tax=Caenorhabditis remanei TaxID=31234 RepID=A0A6A5HBD0_CAERE|nr:hypothetical protein GCK72_004128 [Caenorhabditis remanei]KAF1764181.1 hypothetical protein GCK72_004128 [Caenorhabditis remanei]